MMSGSKSDLLGKVFNKLTVVFEDPIRALNGSVRWNCQCECGKTTTATTTQLIHNLKKSCGCLVTVHGMCYTPEYTSWEAMIQRCTNSNSAQYSDYGGRGITVCQEWLNSFEAFYEDMGPRPSPNHSIEREEVNGNYEKNNCRWATKLEQANNRRNNVFYDYQGEQLTISEISRRTNVSRHALKNRVKEMNLTIDQAVQYVSQRVNHDSITFNGITKSLGKWSEDLDICYRTLYKRLYLYNWPIDKAFSKK